MLSTLTAESLVSGCAFAVAPSMVTDVSDESVAISLMPAAVTDIAIPPGSIP